MIPAAPTSYVSDTVHAMHASTRAAVEDELKRFQAKTGKQIVVYIGDSTGGEALEQYTVEAAQAWKIGQKGKDNGAVLFIFTGDHRARIEVGYGLEGKLTDATSAQIVSGTIVPAMRRDAPDDAVENGVAGIIGALDPNFPTVSSSKSAAPTASNAQIAAYVNDEYSALQKSVKANVAVELKRFQQRTGKRIFVDFDDEIGDLDEDKMDTFASAYATKASVGQKNHPDAVLLVFLKGRRGRIVVGPDLKTALSDDQISTILDKNVTVNLRHEDADDAVQYGVNAMIAQIDPTFTPAVPVPGATSEAVTEDNDDDGSPGAGIAAIVVLLIFLGIVFAIILTIVRRGKPSGNWTDAFLMSRSLRLGSQRRLQRPFRRRRGRRRRRILRRRRQFRRRRSIRRMVV